MLVAVLSDIHSNLRALDAVLGSIGTVDAVWQLGDVVGYGPEPVGVVERLRQIGAIGVKGNHDDAVCGGGSLEGFNPDARIAAEWTRAHVDAATLAYLETLPELLTPDGTDFTLVHGSPRERIWEYLDSTFAALENLAAFGSRYCLIGHTHVPTVFRERRGRVEEVAVAPESGLRLDERRAFLNPGSVGQPRDGDPTASYLILDTSASRATWQRVAYDIDATQKAMLAAGLPPRLARRLRHGR
jgi:predicted phosphodiesterase